MENPVFAFELSNVRPKQQWLDGKQAKKVKYGIPGSNEGFLAYVLIYKLLSRKVMCICKP